MTNANMKYDAEANIISWEISDDPITNTLELGNFLVHVSTSGKPVLIENLNGSKFSGKLEKIGQILPKAQVSDIKQATSLN